MSKKTLVEDADNMIDILTKLSTRQDIWQDMFIYMMAKAIWDLLRAVIKIKERIERDINMVLPQTIPDANVRSVVLCRDCKHSYVCCGKYCCSHGVYVDSIGREDFFCADGEKR